MQESMHCRKSSYNIVSNDNFFEHEGMNLNCLPDKNFFFELQKYFINVDSFLSGNVCTYHNIVKNSILK